MKKFVFLFVIALSTFCFSCSAKSIIQVTKVQDDIVIDGVPDDLAWQMASWRQIDQLIIGKPPSKKDFSGQYKILWDDKQLYLLVQIADDVLFDQNPNPYISYWNDDCLEVFIDEDASGGNHQFNYNAFAYHVALDNQAVDIGGRNPDGSAQVVLLNEHITSHWQRDNKAPHYINWELSIRLFDDSFEKGKSRPVTLKKGKEIGFMLAYCDNDGSAEREHFIGSTFIAPIEGNKNLGYITADVFDQLILIE